MRKMTRFPTLAAIFALALCAARSEAQRVSPAATLASATALGVPNVREPSPGLLTAGQLSQAQMDGLAEAGVATFVSLRLPEEEGAGWEEAYARERGVSFARIPIGGSADLTRANAEALDRILDAAGGKPAVVYCGSGNRAGALLALRAHWLDGMPAAQALELGKAAGMTRLERAVAKLLGIAGGTP
ncbi:MAG: sulfur transferase domain-containing protein [Longimicrobiales bacterium]|nr:sulfur transferase domain-containing protein [Longimicrobiales bacterium]